jgi:hypothetical protein
MSYTQLLDNAAYHKKLNALSNSATRLIAQIQGVMKPLDAAEEGSPTPEILQKVATIRTFLSVIDGLLMVKDGTNAVVAVEKLVENAEALRGGNLVAIPISSIHGSASAKKVEIECGKKVETETESDEDEQNEELDEEMQEKEAQEDVQVKRESAIATEKKSLDVEEKSFVETYVALGYVEREEYKDYPDELRADLAEKVMSGFSDEFLEESINQYFENAVEKVQDVSPPPSKKIKQEHGGKTAVVASTGNGKSVAKPPTQANVQGTASVQPRFRPNVGQGPGPVPAEARVARGPSTGSGGGKHDSIVLD